MEGVYAMLREFQSRGTRFLVCDRGDDKLAELPIPGAYADLFALLNFRSPVSSTAIREAQK
jgi:hypothetical protein